MDLEAVAYHEAGHAVIGLALMRPVLSVTIIPLGDAAGLCNGERGLSPNPSPEEVEALLYELFAGYAAQIRFDPAAVEAAKFASEDDNCKAQPFLRSLGGPIREPYLRQRAAALVAENWPAIVLLASELLQFKTLGGDEVEFIVGISAGCPDAREGLANLRALKIGG
jgi:hypothetical protein